MKKIISFLAFILITNMSLAQEPKYNNFNKLWKEVEQFEKEGLPKSALKVVDKIVEKANNITAIVKIIEKFGIAESNATEVKSTPPTLSPELFNITLLPSKFP